MTVICYTVLTLTYIIIVVNRPAPVYQRPPRQPGSAPFKPPVIPIRPRPPQTQPLPNRYTPQQTAPSQNQPTYVNPGVQGKLILLFLKLLYLIFVHIHFNFFDNIN